MFIFFFCFFCQAEDGIRDLVRSRGLGDVYKRQDITSDGRRNVLISADPVSIDPHIGIEADYKEFIFLRGGVGNVQRYIPDDLYEEAWTLQPNIGLGLVIGPVHLDYAYTNIGKQSEVLYSHVFSLMFDINKSVKPETIAE